MSYKSDGYRKNDMVKKETPYVSIIIPMRNEEKYIAECLNSVLANDYPKDSLEVIVIDGMSIDRSRAIVEEYMKSYSFIRILDNPKQIQAAAMNIGIREAKGSIILRMDAHTTYACDYIHQCVNLLQKSEAKNVGGVQRAVGSNYISNAIAIAITSPFGIGDARFRFSKLEEWVDTVYLGAWYKNTLEDLCGFNEEWVVNEDYELNYRIKQAGGKILLSPNIQCQYHVRSSLKRLAIQYFRYGKWKVKTLVTHPNALRWRQIVPPFLVLFLLLSIFFLPIYWPLGIVVPAFYTITNIVASILTGIKRGWRYLPFLPITFTILHLSWGIGFWAGMFKFGIPRFSIESLKNAFHSPNKI
jgi:cellulose synthase/poly-beta-1,6-N-acetylglucosamine synthase-like glycosyltransferase